jgi:hypothetical protein
MGEREVRSPWSSTGSEARRGYSPGAYSNPGNGKARADGGHIAHNLGKGGHRPVSARAAIATRRSKAASAAHTIREISRSAEHQPRLVRSTKDAGYAARRR